MMYSNEEPFRRKKHRLPGHDYRSDGYYFVTIVTLIRDKFFGSVRNGVMRQNLLGQSVIDAWLELPEICDYVTLDEWQLMPDHFHAVLVMGSPGEGDMDLTGRKSVGRLLGRVKTISTNRILEAGFSIPVPLWQPDYYDEIIRCEHRLNQIQRYIQENPLKWSKKHGQG